MAGVKPFVVNPLEDTRLQVMGSLALWTRLCGDSLHLVRSWHYVIIIVVRCGPCSHCDCWLSFLCMQMNEGLVKRVVQWLHYLIKAELGHKRPGNKFAVSNASKAAERLLLCRYVSCITY